MGKTKKKMVCFSKILLIADYSVLAFMLYAYIKFPGFDTTNWALVIIAWIAQIAISTGAYYWKAKAENLVKLPLLLLAELPKDMREKADPNEIISAVLGIGTSNN